MANIATKKNTKINMFIINMLTTCTIIYYYYIINTTYSSRCTIVGHILKSKISNIQKAVAAWVVTAEMNNHPYIRYMKLKNRIWQQRRNEESESAIAAAVAAGSTMWSARPDGKVVVVQEETTIDVINVVDISNNNTVLVSWSLSLSLSLSSSSSSSKQKQQQYSRTERQHFDCFSS